MPRRVPTSYCWTCSCLQWTVSPYLRGLRQQGFSAPVVALTGYDDGETRRRCDREGFASFLSKPVAEGRLLEAINSCLHAEREFDSTKTNESRGTDESMTRLIEATMAARGYTEENRRRMMEIAPKEIRQHLTAIIEALAAGDYHTISRETHSLKGSFGALGLMDYHRRTAQMHLAIRIYLDPGAFAGRTQRRRAPLPGTGGDKPSAASPGINLISRHLRTCRG